MGRWGHRMFEGDRDSDILLDMEDHVGIKEKWTYGMNDLVMDGRDEIVTYVREKLDTNNYGEVLFTNCKAKEPQWEGKYYTIILGAIMMAAGAHISPENMQHLRELALRTHCSPGYAMPLNDEGFRGPGQAQFMAALNHYQPGTPRRFFDLTCFNCGKNEGDLGKSLLKCSRCQLSWYCDKHCQRANWRHHKSACVPPGSRFLLNV